MRVAIYARYSSDTQSEASIEDQVRICRARALREGWLVSGVYTDYAISGANADRPQLLELLADARSGSLDIVLAEALDRMSRDQEHIARFYKQMSFLGVRIVTLAEGDISELHVGLKGTMNALFLKDLAQKTHRGLEGRVRAGRSGGGNAFGYRVVHRLAADGERVTGERMIDAGEAATIQRIFRDYAAGISPKRIAHHLNAEGIVAPRGGAWSASTINGNRARGTGILNNELYIGRLVWNRLTYIKDPETGRRRSRKRADTEQVVTEVPELRIIHAVLWDAVKARQAALDRRASQVPQSSASAPFWSKQRPRYLFSGLMRCAICGGGFSKIGATRFGCSSARNKGPTACANRLTIRRDALEATVLDGMLHRLMNPDLFKVFVAEFTAEWNRVQATSSAEQAAHQAELTRVRRQIDRLVDALVDGTPASAVKDRLAALEHRRLVLEESLATAAAPAPRLYPNLAEIYRQKVATLTDLLRREDAAEVREMVRGLVETIVLVPEGERLRIEIHGELATILGLAEGAKNAKGIAHAGAVAEQIKAVAGRGFEPLTFRL